MENEYKLLSGAMVTLALATATLVILPYMQLAEVKPPEKLQPYTDQMLRGRDVYIAMGCVYCHSQQPRSQAQAPDFQRGWGRASVAADYVYDRPHLLGTMRTGPDLFNIGARQPSVDWHLGHLYAPQAYTPGSTMPAFPFLFTVKDKAQEGDKVLALPPGAQPLGQIVVAKPEALDLVQYLVGLNHTYPVDLGVELPEGPSERVTTAGAADD